MLYKIYTDTNKELSDRRTCQELINLKEIHTSQNAGVSSSQPSFYFSHEVSYFQK